MRPVETTEGDVGLVEDVGAVGGVVVGGQRDLRLIGVDGAGHEVLIEAVVVADERAVAERQPRRRGARSGRDAELTVGLHVAQVGIAVERRGIDVGRPALKRRDAAIGGARVVQVLVAKRDLVFGRSARR